jgi:hypothetical protein
MKKKKAALEMLEAQKVIEEVEAEAGQSVPQAILASLHSQCYQIEDSSSVEGRFITAISGITLAPAQG